MSVPLTAERLRKVLEYDPETGIFTRATSFHNRYVGKEAGTLTMDGYKSILINGKIYRAHRLAWLYTYDFFPELMLDHVNGDRSDNRIANLRMCGYSNNQENRSLSGSGAIKYLGVYFDKRRKKFISQITSQGVTKHLGSFATALEAHEAYLIAKKALHVFQGWQP